MIDILQVKQFVADHVGKPGLLEQRAAQIHKQAEEHQAHTPIGSTDSTAPTTAPVAAPDWLRSVGEQMSPAAKRIHAKLTAPKPS